MPFAGIKIIYTDITITTTKLDLLNIGNCSSNNNFQIQRSCKVLKHGRWPTTYSVNILQLHLANFLSKRSDSKVQELKIVAQEVCEKEVFVSSVNKDLIVCVCMCQVTRIVLLWVNNHFNDFEGDPAMTHFLEDFEKRLEATVRHHSKCSIYFIWTYLVVMNFVFPYKSALHSLGNRSLSSLSYLCQCLSENEGPFAAAEHSLCSQGQVETDHSSEGIQGVAALLQCAGRQWEGIRHLRWISRRRKQGCRGRTQTGRPGESNQCNTYSGKIQFCPTRYETLSPVLFDEWNWQFCSSTDGCRPTREPFFYVF